jgi:hypothetical protein
VTTSTIPTPITVTRVPSILDDQDGMEQLRDGLGNASAFMPVELERLGDHDPAHAAWERVVDAAIAEVAPAVAAMLDAAIDKRLPVTL